MKSKTSFFNGTVFKKNLTRFAPVWGLYILCLLLGMVLLLDADITYWFPAHFADLVNIMAIVNLGYALLVAEILFGDLYNTRMCNALHAMPMRRECWFFTNVSSGVFFSLLPTVIMAAAATLIIGIFSSMVNGWQIPLYWLLANTLEYTFFFGLAVFSAFCSGSRVGMAVVYAILNFFSYMGYFLLDTVYVPALHGVVLQSELFEQLCPTAWVASREFIDCTRHDEFMGYTPDGHEKYNIYGTFQLTDEWHYLWIIAAVGILLTLVALVMYRRRRLECAGDVISTKKLEPVFMVLFSLSAAVVCHFIITQMLGFGYGEGYSIFLFIGLAVGWFAGRMMLERQSAVFRKGRNWLGLAVLAAVFGLSMYINTLDPFGIVTWMPEAEEAALVEFGVGWRGEVDSDDPQVIADVLRIHELALEEMITAEDISAEELKRVTKEPSLESVDEPDYRESCSFSVGYTLKDGRKVQRRYYLWIDSEAGRLLERYASSVEAIFHIETPEDLLNIAAAPDFMAVEGVQLPKELLTKETMESFLRAVIADCEAGTMAQYSGFHDSKVIDEENLQLQYYSVELQLGGGKDYMYLNIYADSENCMAWLESIDILDAVREEVSGYYG